MASVMIRCANAQPEKDKDGSVLRIVRCHRRNRVIAPQGVAVDLNASWKCETCAVGQKPYEPRSSARKGQQKQKKS